MLGEPTFLRHTARKNENNFKYFLVVFKLFVNYSYCIKSGYCFAPP